MVKINKRPLPANIKITSESDYTSGIVFQMLCEDCYDKCYICEDNPTSINVEHRISHRGDLTLKYDWNNLFLSCSHCNNTKSDKYDGIIDPSLLDPEDYMDFSIDGLLETVNIKKISGGDDVDITVRLLDNVYNGTTDIKRFEAINLKNRISQELMRFELQLNLYNQEPTKERYDYISKQISRASIFAAFKRKIIRDNHELSDIFSGSLA